MNDSRVDPSGGNNEAIIRASSFGHAAVVELLLTNCNVDASNALEIAIRSKNYGTVSIINNARPKLLIDENVLNLANKTIQVKTTLSVENNKLIVNYESEYDYEATFVLTFNDESTVYLNVDNISKGKLSIEMSKVSEYNEWNWRWICAKQTIENTGQFDMESIHSNIPDKSNIPCSDNSNSNNLTTSDSSIVSDEKKFPFWIISVIVVSAVIIISMTIIVYLCIRSRRRQRNLARLRAFGNGKLHIFHIGPVETIGKQRRLRR